MATNGGNFGICYSYIDDSGNESLLSVRKYGSALSLLILIEHEFERMVYHRAKYIFIFSSGHRAQITCSL